MKTILILGNGFDLAHSLPTSYRDFLIFCEIINRAFFYQTISEFDQDLEEHFGKYPTIKQKLLNEFSLHFPHKKKDYSQIVDEIHDNAIKEFFKMILKNIWINYFLNLEKSNFYKKNWVDFETEIFNVIQYLESSPNEDDNSSINKLILNLKSVNKENKDYEYNTDPLEDDLRRLIRALEIYLTEFVEKIPLDNSQKKFYIESIKPDFVLSFNYTNTYEKLYDDNNYGPEYEYIHGFASIDNTETTNNMVLGISESLPDNRKNTDLRFIAFKKYYQRIYKKNGNRYLSWLKELETNIEKTTETNSKLKEHNKSLFNDTNSITLNQRSQMCELLEIPQYKLYIWGHSLDSTDGDVIKKFLCCDNIITTIYYLNNDLDLKEKISNLVRIIGQEELISRTGNLQTIRFEPIPE